MAKTNEITRQSTKAFLVNTRAAPSTEAMAR